MQIRGRFLGQAGQTKKQDAYIRKFVTDDGNLLAVYARTEAKLSQEGPVTIEVGIPDGQLVFLRDTNKPSSINRVA